MTDMCRKRKFRWFGHK